MTVHTLENGLSSSVMRSKPVEDRFILFSCVAGIAADLQYGVRDNKVLPGVDGVGWDFQTGASYLLAEVAQGIDKSRGGSGIQWQLVCN